MRRLVPRVLGAGAPLLWLTLAIACGGSPPGAGAPGGGRGGGQGVPVEVLELAQRPLEDSAEFVGMLKSRRSSTIQPQAEGFVTKIFVTSGERVDVGAPLFEIDASTQQAAVASLQSTQAAREAEAAFARQQSARFKTLLSVGAASQQEFDQAVAQERSADAQLKAVQEQIRQQQAELAYYRVVAQTAGVIGDVPVRVGERVVRSTTLTTIDDNAGIEVYIGVPVQQASRLRLGLPVRLLNDQNEAIASERISFIAASVDDATQTVLVKTPLSASGGQFRGEQSVRAQVVFATTSGLTVPVVAVTRVNGQFFVFVVEGGERGTVARQRAVTLGPVTGSDYIVRSGLNVGERLIVGGIQKIGDGAPVTPMPPAGGGR